MAYPSLKTTDDIALIEAWWVAHSRDSFWHYRWYMRPDMFITWWQRDVARRLQQFFVDLVSGQRPILLIQAPPQHGKTEQAVDFIAWVSGIIPDLKTIYASFSDRLGIRANLTLQRTYDSRKYQQIFPETRIAKRGSGFQAQKSRNREIIEYLETEGYFRNTTVRGPINGEGLDLGVIDDPIKNREEANSETVRNKTWDWLTDDLLGRFSDHAGLLGIMTRWHLDDPFGRLQKHMPERVQVVRYPAVAEQDEDHRKEGEALFPAHKPLDFLMERKNVMHPANWEALYQQNPVVLGGGIFRDEWLQYYRTLPKLRYRVIFGDTAQKEKQQNDYTVFQCWGKGIDGRIYLLDMIRWKWEAPELLVNAQAFWEKHRSDGTPGIGALRQMKIEDKVSGTGLIQQLQRKGIPVEGIPRDTDKVLRAYDTSPQIQAGNVLLPESAPYLSDILAELSPFPNGAHDDTVDPLMDAINEMLIEDGTTEYSEML